MLCCSSTSGLLANAGPSAGCLHGDGPTSHFDRRGRCHGHRRDRHHGSCRACCRRRCAGSAESSPNRSSRHFVDLRATHTDTVRPRTIMRQCATRATYRESKAPWGGEGHTCQCNRPAWRPRRARCSRPRWPTVGACRCSHTICVCE